jgi:hypothetical protein
MLRPALRLDLFRGFCHRASRSIHDRSAYQTSRRIDNCLGGYVSIRWKRLTGVGMIPALRLVPPGYTLVTPGSDIGGLNPLLRQSASWRSLHSAHPETPFFDFNGFHFFYCNDQ